LKTNAVGEVEIIRGFKFIMVPSIALHVRLDRGAFLIDTFDGAKPRFSNRGIKRRSVSTLSIPRALDRGVEWVDFFHHDKFPAVNPISKFYKNFFSIGA